MKQKKRTFLLLELLIAFSLLSLFSLPFMVLPQKKLRTEQARLEDISSILLGEQALLIVKEALYTNEIPWTEFPKNKNKPLIKTIPEDFKTAIPFPKTKKLSAHFFWKKGPHKKHPGGHFGLLACHLFPEGNHTEPLFCYEICVDSLSIDDLTHEKKR